MPSVAGSGLLADQRQEHGVRPVDVRPELGGELVTGAEVAGEADAVQHGAGVEQFKVLAFAQHVADDGGGFGRVRRARHVGHDAAGPARPPAPT